MSCKIQRRGKFWPVLDAAGRQIGWIDPGTKLLACTVRIFWPPPFEQLFDDERRVDLAMTHFTQQRPATAWNEAHGFTIDDIAIVQSTDNGPEHCEVILTRTFQSIQECRELLPVVSQITHDLHLTTDNLPQYKP